MTPTEVLNMLNKKSGFLGLSGVSSDMRDVWAAAKEGNEKAKLALEQWAYRISKYIGAYAAAMGGIDAIVFTAGIGENDYVARAMVCEPLKFMGVEIDEAKNTGKRDEGVISADSSKVTVMVIPTNEELAIAKDTLELCAK